MPAKKKSTKNHRKASDATKRLNKRQSDYLKGVVAGKTKKQAALDAGYSESSAENAAAIIEGPDVRAAFQQIIRQHISPKKIAQRIAEGLDAMDTKFANYEGQITDSRDVVDWESRRRYAEMAAKMGGYYIDRQEIEHSTKDIGERSNDELKFFLQHGVWPEQIAAGNA